MIKPALSAILTVLICLPALAGDEDRKRAEREAELRKMRDKEVGRANEAAQYAGNMEHLERKFGWAKEHFGQQYHQLAEKRKTAARAWKDAANQIKHAQNYEQVNAIKIAAHEAGAAAYLAELELKAAGSEMHWKRSADKIGTEAARKAARDLMEVQRVTLEVTKAKMLNEHHLRGLAWQRHEKEKALEQEYEKMKHKEELARRKPGRKPSNTNGRPLKKPDHDKPAAKPEKPRIRIE